MSRGGKRPYSEEKITENIYLRTFSLSSESKEFQWHRDREDRIVEVISGAGWRFQLDNSLPVELFPGDKIMIEKNTWHRIFKGSTQLAVVIKKCF